MFALPAKTPPTLVNLSYTLDSRSAGTFLHTGNPNAPNTSYSSSVIVFQKTGLQRSPHALTVTVGPDSLFLLDYIVYTHEDDFDNNATSGTFLPTPSLTLVAGAAKTSPSPILSQCVNSAFTSGSVVLLANQAYLPFAGTSVLAPLSFGVRCSLDVNLIRSSFTTHARPPLASCTPRLPYTIQRNPTSYFSPLDSLSLLSGPPLLPCTSHWSPERQRPRVRTTSRIMLRRSQEQLEAQWDCFRCSRSPSPSRSIADVFAHDVEIAHTVTHAMKTTPSDPSTPMAQRTGPLCKDQSPSYRDTFLVRSSPLRHHRTLRLQNHRTSPRAHCSVHRRRWSRGHRAERGSL